MFALVFLLSCFQAEARPRVSHKDLANGHPYSFDEYLVDFKKSYPESQMGYRKVPLLHNAKFVSKVLIRRICLGHL